MTATKLLASSLSSFVALVALFAVHRLLSLGHLSSTELSPLLGGQALLVGLLSDVWVAAISATLIFLVSGAFILAHCPKTARIAPLAMLLAYGLAYAGHQAYVDFYHAQIAPFHIRYLFDPDFLAANGTSLFGWKSVVVFLGLLMPLIWLFGANVFGKTSAKKLTAYAIALLVLSLFAHNRNIHLRTQWFVQDSLQVNAAEHLYLRYKYASLPKPLSAAEMTQLAETLHNPLPKHPDAPTADDLLQLLTKPAADSVAISPLGVALKAEFQRLIAAGERPLALVALLESLRPSETGYFAPSVTPSLTPRIDDAKSRGIAFMRAFSTGSVTRGGQEAVFCGYLGSRETSLLSGHTQLKVGCLPDLARESRHHPDVFWYHGGEGRFDNQLAFWQGRGLADSMSLQDFSRDAARSDWGIGDRTFFEAVAFRLNELNRKSRADYVLGMALSISNHIPWSLPSDGADLTLPKPLTHPSYATTFYTDYAMGELFDSLHASGLWQKTLLVVASDHGNNVPPYSDIYPGSSVKASMLQSHINFLLIGGVVESALKAVNETQIELKQPTSQADIAALLAYVTDLKEARFMGENPFRLHRELPVVSILEETFFDPATGSVYRTEDAAKLSGDHLETARAPAVLYFRAFLQYINTWSRRASASGG